MWSAVRKNDCSSCAQRSRLRPFVHDVVETLDEFAQNLGTAETLKRSVKHGNLSGQHR
jgi:hypothetical protein